MPVEPTPRRRRLGTEIRRAREALGWSQEEAAQRLGYRALSTVSKIENGSQGVKVQQLAHFFEVLAQDHRQGTHIMNKNDLDPAWLTNQLSRAQWQTASSGGSTCVQVAFLDNDIIAIRDSKNPDKAPHIFDDAEYDAFVAGIMRGELRRS
ncbi:DUF397 domain-containing protein [Kitasatospora sp. GAS204B]|uniref:DUF397 domain-containing protein n=1 Tax=unclassified Kitasatospora TaxID=2633591 RepID=UPI0024735E02|nr:DUF397 domain-containing protein [Kitasatospora sp. GAS204B]MDH6122726.1 transcriptional regulator with XRE-family HTH domain [Kitasatospora sp. GAS204B]